MASILEKAAETIQRLGSAAQDCKSCARLPICNAYQAEGRFENCDYKWVHEDEATDVQTVKRGKWIENTYKYIKELDAYFVQAKCTVCGRYSDKIDIYTGYMSNECCSHCGARMDGGENGR